MKKKYAVVFEPSKTGYGAYAPDVPGCVSTGRTLAETRRMMKEALEFHLRSMREDKDPIPKPAHVVESLEVTF